ncbi:type ISP restriction/modification enzyme [Mycobacterium tuberculosis]|uniref:type ISP restriction/modification enzyme n=1 Tax=Mycobacterium tuberculosis TaxID=1773 RepID=UPI00045AA2AA|nr:type ISP restriction/modification enzyme [Mycobacterium tuberculosis]KAP26544.1 hypothetical protein AJ01_03651 [Mycobacterium tuberculosis MD17021]KCN40093.1 hypothetical protein X099_02633 [Mycobacterium tuberculosis BTB05-650]KCN52726.1 hypothetical protein X102_02098 [Mycobacterium tuberculosis BTB06-340]KCP85099.1 hypothetical protein X169_02089 [Mycobacterium tuberculosis BTB10-257]KCT08572.1 hypothetical protein X335_00570 [Mycobacterium tuberculosis XTB13-116]
MGSVHDVIEAFRKAPSNAERGTKFEQLMVRYFELDPTMAQQYDAVWRWIDWPERRGRTDTGIDLVARERDTGNYTAIQCKFYEPTHTLAKGDIDSFFTASGKTGFTNRVIISTTDRWGRNAEDALADQLVPVQRIGMAEIAESPIDWDIAWPAGDLQVNLTPAKRHELRPHQQQAIDAVFRGFAVGNDRGKLIMACGTGKTFTALKIAERIAADNGGSARILLLVPSISLLSQTLREWTAQSELDVRAFAVCSDTKVSRSAEDYHVHDVPIPVTTDARVLLHEMAHRRRAQGLTVVFCTYQSLPTVAKAQRLGVDEFDLVMCDEAHRTTGVTLAGDDESNFVRVHDGQYLKAARRLYMTATPRIFTESIKDRADQHSAELVSMDDELTFGPEFHRLSFGEAVERGLLTDYKVMVLTVDQGVIAPRLQQELSGVSGELMLDDASKIVGCWNGLAKRSGTGIVAGEPPMRRAVAFAKDIKTSKQVAELFPKVVEAYRELVDDGPGLACSVRHVDGTFNALVRNEQLAWLKGVVAEDECRILSTAADLTRKYSQELHANEIMLLAYYIAAVNIESTYHALAGKTADADAYEPFPGMALADTFQISEAGDSMDAIMFPYNNARILRQLATPISVIIGNPPYSVGQSSANDLNANVKYPTLDGRIEQTYAKRSTAQLKNSLYDSYIRAFRWATDRIGDNGVVGFVSNGGYIDGNTADGMRLSLADDYAAVYVYNLRGNQRTAGELSRQEGGKVFGGGSRNTVAIFLGIKDPKHSGPCDVLYRDIGDYLSREEKLRIVGDGYLDTVEWQTVTPNLHGDWVNQRDDAFSAWPVIGDKKAALDVTRVFANYSAGLKTSRDAWCYNFSRGALEANIGRTIDFYNSEVDRINEIRGRDAKTPPVDALITVDSAKFSWDRINKRQVAQGIRIEFAPAGMRLGTYRPFTKEHAYLDPNQQLNNCTYQLPSMFPTPEHGNVGYYVVGMGSDKPFSCLMLNAIPDLAFWGSSNGQFFPRWTYEKTEPRDGELDFESTTNAEVDDHGYRRVDNITGVILKLYRDTIGDQVTKDDIFYYVYGLLHDPAYRTKYAADLKKMLPHIPTPETRERFDQLASAGRKLADLHVGYESVKPYPLDVQLKPGADPEDRETWRVEKMKWKSKQDHSTIIYNSRVTIAGIPDEAERYLLGSRSALGWIIDRYRVTTDKASGIVNDPNDWCDEHANPTYIVDLIKKVTTVSVETMKIVDSIVALASAGSDST